MEEIERSCIDCAVKNCSRMDKTYPDFCLTTHMDPDVLEEAMACYQQEEVRRISIAAAEVEYEHYCRYTRVEEIVAFAHKIGAKKLGIATCVGHDSLFYRYSDAPVTTAVTKDRVTGHNPAAALYTADSYYQRLRQEIDPQGK